MIPRVFFFIKKIGISRIPLTIYLHLHAIYLSILFGDDVTILINSAKWEGFFCFAAWLAKPVYVYHHYELVYRSDGEGHEVVHSILDDTVFRC